MTTTRRGFLGAILAAGVAPAVVRYANLMPVRRLSSGLVVPIRIGQVVYSNAMLQAWEDAMPMTPDQTWSGHLLVTPDPQERARWVTLDIGKWEILR